MRILPALTAFVAIAALSCAAAQDDSGRMLIDPATGQPRYVPPLLQPWQDETVRLHPPRKHHKSTTAVAPITATPPASVASAAEAAPTETPKRHKTKRVAAAAPTAPAAQQTQPPQQAGNFSDFTDLISPQKAAAPPKKVASTPPPKPVERAKPIETAPAKPERTASIEPPKPARAAHVAAGTRKDSIVFAPNATDPTTSAVSSVHNLAGALSSALGASSARVQLLAYAGMKGEKSSDTRRLSLKRALVIRQLLIDDGVPSERIDVFALGGADDDGPLDRVDIFIKS